MQIGILVTGVVFILSMIAMAFNMAKQRGIDEQRMTNYEIVLEDKENDQEIASRPDDDAIDLLERMRTEND